ncbi:MAG: beta-propeller domain-containing protein [Clostridia bacterium]|nr:beta-propeller domain-containing protein [Clostridia bacterium]
MKKKNWYQGLSLADDKYIEEAHPQHNIRPKRNKAILSCIAACACLALIFCNLWLFVPYNTEPPDVSKYAQSEYYGIIQKINALTFQPPRYKNNAQKLWSAIKTFGLKTGTMLEDNAVPAPGAPAGSDAPYKEITDNQVQGITEADRIKRSDTHIYYLDVDKLRIFLIDKENTCEVGNYSLYHGENNPSFDQWEFYLSDDCQTATIISQHHQTESDKISRYVRVLSLDVSDPANITKKDEFTITGAYLSSRLTDGHILLLTEFTILREDLDFDDVSTFLPQINEGNGAYPIPASHVLSPERLNESRYTVVLKLDENSLDLKGTAAYLSYSQNVYVSKEHLFLTHVFADQKENEDGSTTRNAMTEISCLTYGGDTFEVKGSATVRGYVKDQWSMDEYQGILRVFTTTNATIISPRHYENTRPDILQTATGQSNASLYCIDLATFEVVASVIDFAPPREEVQSVRFDKNTAYVCTSIELSDPVFFFDLSDLAHITYKDTGTIEGFSTSLINLGNGYLLGIGRGDRWSSFKVEVYEQTSDGVRSVCSYELENTQYATEYKSYYVDREHQLVGIGIKHTNYISNPHDSRYILLHFDGYDLVELVNVRLEGDNIFKRGVYIDGYMYMFGVDDFKVEKVFD